MHLTERKIANEQIQLLQVHGIVPDAPLVLVLLQKLRRRRLERVIDSSPKHPCRT